MLILKLVEMLISRCEIIEVQEKWWEDGKSVIENVFTELVKVRLSRVDSFVFAPPLLLRSVRFTA